MTPSPPAGPLPRRRGVVAAAALVAGFVALTVFATLAFQMTTSPPTDAVPDDPAPPAETDAPATGSDATQAAARPISAPPESGPGVTFRVEKPRRTPRPRAATSSVAPRLPQTASRTAAPAGSGAPAAATTAGTPVDAPIETQDVGAPDVAPGAETDGATRTLVAVRTIDPSSIVEGRVRGADGKPLKFVWVRFHPVDGGFAIQTLTDVDGNFRKTAAWDVAYDARVLVPGEDGRLVPGPKLGVVRGGDRGLELRVPR